MRRIHIQLLAAVSLLPLFLGKAEAQSTEDQAAEAYVDALETLQQARVRLFQNAYMLVQADQNLRASVFQKELNAAKSAQVAVGTPEISTRISTPDSKSSSSKSSSSKSKSQSPVMTLVDNSAFKNAMASDAYFWKLQSMFDQSKLQQTHVAFRGVMTELNANLIGFCNLADMYGWRSNAESKSAAELTETWLKDDPSNVGAMLVRAAALRNLGQREIAQRLATDAQKFPTIALPLASTLVAQCQILDANNADAHRQLATAIKMSRGSALENPLVIRAMLWASEGNFIKAIDDAKKATASDKTEAYALCIQALLECESDEKHEKVRLAQEHAKQAAKISAGRTWQILEILAHVEAKAGDFASAEKFIQDAAERSFGERKAKLEDSLAIYQSKSLPPFAWQDYMESMWAPYR